MKAAPPAQGKIFAGNILNILGEIGSLTCTPRPENPKAESRTPNTKLPATHAASLGYLRSLIIPWLWKFSQ